MSNVKEIATSIFPLETGIKCKDIAEHVLCLLCTKCRATHEDRVVDDFRNINQYIDHTLLKADAQPADIIKLCEEAYEHKFKSVCINPTYIDIVKSYTYSPPICTVIGFPLGASISKVKLFEAKAAIESGAKEIDMVINIGFMKDSMYLYIFDEISQIAKVCEENNVLLKVIIETCLLTEEEIIKACLIAKKAGTDFIKTSTGFFASGAEVNTVNLIRKVVGRKVGVKASGGIKTKANVLAMLEAGASRIGTSNSVSIVKEIEGNSIEQSRQNLY